MLNEEGIKALLPKPKAQVNVDTDPPILEQPTPQPTNPPGTVVATNAPVAGEGDRLLFDPADFRNYDTVTPPPQAIENAMATTDTMNITGSQPLENQITQEIEIPDTQPPSSNKNVSIIISIAIALAVIALIAFFVMRRKSPGGNGNAIPSPSPVLSPQ